MSKRINISIPDDKVHILTAFDKICKKSRSEGLMDLMAQAVDGSRIGMSKDELEADLHGPFTDADSLMASLNDEPPAIELPEFLR